MDRTHHYDIDQLMQEWRINGFAVFEDLIPVEKIDRILEAWGPIRDLDIERQGEYPPRGRFRYNVRVPFERPFVDPEIFEHPALVEFLERALGADYVWSHFDSNIPPAGHRLSAMAPRRLPHGSARPHDEGLLRGRQVPAGGHQQRKRQLRSHPLHPVHRRRRPALRSGRGPGRRRKQPRPLLSHPAQPKKGSLWVQDGRAFHRGTPNRSDRPRDELCMAFCQPWVFSNWLHEYTEDHFPQDLWESLSDHARQVLRWQRVKDQ